MIGHLCGGEKQEKEKINKEIKRVWTLCMNENEMKGRKII